MTSVSALKLLLNRMLFIPNKHGGRASEIDGTDVNYTIVCKPIRVDVDTVRSFK